MSVCSVNYWDRLKALKITSLERRRERYMIFFLYKILIRKYPDPGLNIEAVDLGARLGVKVLPKLDLKAADWVCNLRGASFFNKAPQLFNILPAEIRHPKFFLDPTIKLMESFKKAVDRYLSTVPDQPTTDNLPSSMRAALTNSILFQDRYKVPPPDGSYVPE